MLVRERKDEAEEKPSQYSVALMPQRRRGRAVLYSGMTEERLTEVVDEHLVSGRVVRRYLIQRPVSAARAEATPAKHRLPQVLSSLREAATDGDG